MTNLEKMKQDISSFIDSLQGEHLYRLVNDFDAFQSHLEYFAEPIVFPDYISNYFNYRKKHKVTYEHFEKGIFDLEKMKQDMVCFINALSAEDMHGIVDEIYSFQVDTAYYYEETIELPESIFTCFKCREKYKGDCGDDEKNYCKKHFVEHCKEEYRE